MTLKMTSNKPYLIKAFYEWISDNDLTPYILVDVSVIGVLVPMAYVQKNEIVLNVSGGAVGSIALGEQAIEFSARFGGKLEHLYVPYGAIAAIYAKENGAGSSFEIEHPDPEEETISFSPTLSSVSDNSNNETEQAKPVTDKKNNDKKRPSLKVIK